MVSFKDPIDSGSNPPGSNRDVTVDSDVTDMRDVTDMTGITDITDPADNARDGFSADSADSAGVEGYTRTQPRQGNPLRCPYSYNEPTFRAFFEYYKIE